VNLVLVAGLAIGIMLYGILRLGEAAVRYALRYNKTLLLFVDDDAGTYSLHRGKPRDGEVTLGSKRTDDERTYILNGRSRYNGTLGPLHMIHPEYGWNYRVPSEAETIDKNPLLHIMSISDPGAYHRAIRRNEYRDSLNANDDADDRIARMAALMPYVLGGVLILVGAFVFLVIQMR
jgi:hypothetical protein